jgi:SnoaL-like domain
MATNIDELLRRMLDDVFGQRDPASRADAIAELFRPDCVFSDPDGTHIGHAAIEKAAAEVQARFPGFRFTAVLRQSLQDAGRQHWVFGLPGEPPQVSGLDLIIVVDGKIRALYTFLDPAKGP